MPRPTSSCSPRRRSPVTASASSSTTPPTEFNYLAPNFGEKYSPPHLPVSVRDWTDREITRVYSDQFGSYNFLVPSSLHDQPAVPVGRDAQHDGGVHEPPGADHEDRRQPTAPTGRQLDPYFNRNYTTFCYTLQYLPGKTTYLDTPVLPVAAFASVTSRTRSTANATTVRPRSTASLTPARMTGRGYRRLATATSRSCRRVWRTWPTRPTTRWSCSL